MNGHRPGCRIPLRGRKVDSGRFSARLKLQWNSTNQGSEIRSLHIKCPQE